MHGIDYVAGVSPFMVVLVVVVVVAADVLLVVLNVDAVSTVVLVEVVVDVVVDVEKGRVDSTVVAVTINVVAEQDHHVKIN